MDEYKRFKVNQHAIIRNSEGDVLIMKNDSDTWQLPGGRLEEGETAEGGLLREIKEETGISDCEMDRMLGVGLSESGNTYGVVFLCTTSENLVSVSDEHKEYEWVSPKELRDYTFSHNEMKNGMVNFLKNEV